MIISALDTPLLVLLLLLLQLMLLSGPAEFIDEHDDEEEEEMGVRNDGLFVWIQESSETMTELSEWLSSLLLNCCFLSIDDVKIKLEFEVKVKFEMVEVEFLLLLLLFIGNFNCKRFRRTRKADPVPKIRNGGPDNLNYNCYC